MSYVSDLVNYLSRKLLFPFHIFLCSFKYATISNSHKATTSNIVENRILNIAHIVMLVLYLPHKSNNIKKRQIALIYT